TFVAGAAVGAGAVLATRPSEPRVVYVGRPAPVAPPPSPSTPPADRTVSPYSLPSAPDVPRRALSSAPAPASATRRDTLKEERAIVEAARSKLAAGEVETALER